MANTPRDLDKSMPCGDGRRGDAIDSQEIEADRRTLARNTGRPLSEAAGQRQKHPISKNPRNG